MKQVQNLKSLLVLIVSGFLILLFAYTGVSKLLMFQNFIEQLRQVEFLRPIALPIAIVLPLTELVVSMLLLLPGTRLIGFWCVLIMLFSFIVYISSMLVFSPSLPCSCGGVLQSLSWQAHLVFNAIVTVATLVAMKWYSSTAPFTSIINPDLISNSSRDNRRSRKPETE